MTKLRNVMNVLTEKFGGVTAYTRAPAEGLWKDGALREEDDIVMVEVMSTQAEARWWEKFRAELEDKFDQKEILIRRSSVTKV